MKSYIESLHAVLIKLRKEDPLKFGKLEERIRGDETPGYIETSVGFKIAASTIEYHPQSPEGSMSQGFRTAATTIKYPLLNRQNAVRLKDS